MSSDNTGAEGNPSGVLPVGVGSGRTDNTADQLVSIQLEYPEQYFAAVEAVQHDTKRKILTALRDGLGSVSYNEIEQYTTVSRRTLRKHVQNLEDSEIVERVDSRSYAISYSRFESRVLVTHALDCYYKQEI